MHSRMAYVLGMALALGAGVAHASQYPVMDKVAAKVIQKYRAASCQELWEKRGEPKSEEEQRAIEFLRSDPKIRTLFINKVAGTIVNRMFDCGMIP